MNMDNNLNIKKLLGKRIQEIRKSKHLTQESLSELVNIEIPNISNIENGKNYPSNENLQKIAQALNVRPFELYMFDSHRDVNELKQEMFTALDNNEKLTRLMYKFYLSVKF